MSPLEVGAWLARLAHLISLTIVVGAAALLALASPDRPGTPLGPYTLRLSAAVRRSLRRGAALLLAALAALLATQSGAFRDPFEPFFPQLVGLLGRTSWGTTWLVQVGLAAALLARVRRPRRSPWLGLGLALASAASLGFTGHSWAAERWQAVLVVADGAHAVSASFWLGGLVLIVLGALRSPPDALEGLPEVIGRFSPWAVAAVGCLAVTGSVSGLAHAGGVGALLDPGWSRALLVKLGLFGVMAALGAYNWRFTRPRLGAGGDASSFARGAGGVEAAIGLLILVVTSLLVALPPPAGP